MPWGVANYSTNPDLNNLINGHDIGEGSDAGGYNDALRQLMADIAVWVSSGLATLGGLEAQYRDIPIIGKNGSFTFADAERAHGMLLGGGASIATIDPEATTPITYGAVYPIHNASTAAWTIKRGAGVTLRANGSLVTADVTIAQGGSATLIKWGADYWIANGSGLS